MRDSNTGVTPGYTMSALALLACTVILFTVVSAANKAYAESKFTLQTDTNTGNVKGPIKLKVLASANSETKVKKTGTITAPNSGIISIPFDFKTKNEIVTAGFHDEYFVCGYILDAKTDDMISYKCNEEDLLDEKGPNKVVLDSFITVPKSSGSDPKDVKIRILVPLSDKPDAHRIKVVAAVKGEFQSKVIDVEKAKGKTISVMFTFNRDTDIGKIELGDQYSTCVSANELNPPEGTECEKRHIKLLDEPNELAAR